MTHWPPEASWLTTMTFSTLDCKVCGFILYLPVDKMPLKKVCPCVLCASVCLHVHEYKTYWLVFRPPGRMMEILHESHLADAGPVFNMKMRWVLLPHHEHLNCCSDDSQKTDKLSDQAAHITHSISIQV